ncbi:chemotaxis protein CheW [Xanthomonas campestris]|uniref:chemotaxis protein CheW n=1 Tax=Xanthomonas campestris TaxID=339 RepID=UPI00101AD42A|nr:chemotaxis protein CheW [Xanthomonas campestris]MEB1303461.1 chemotaxis protein CheW [Xanthomonas campestris pv. campestris]MEB1312049.1 chemotaxis protein CheW [Xanthomonas campestris pv. campestris]MEB1337090.1 chemotaxis protein CheW [Xanthomonas campestris pv. campestris]MEB1901281.1 chemotaxis protein CheW [Xanthomonas campestris pv. campestris]WVL67288.1 chemotaxis protein CheW [Xanthomonas campestris pv. campestris]
MSNHTANGELDDYLEGLLHDAGVEIDVATVTAVASAAPVAAEADLAQADDLAVAEPPVQATAAAQVSAPVLSAEAIAADFLAEMDADPAFGPPVVAAPSADDIAADFLAEMDADPAFAPRVVAPSAADIAADFLAEMDADPAFGPPVVAAPSAADIAADFLAEMDADPAFATAAPSPFMSTEDLMAEMDADPAFASAEPSADMIAADLLAELDSDPAFGLDAAPVAVPVPAPARPAPAPARAAPAPVYPQGLQALLAPGQAEHIHAERRASERSTRWLRLRCGEQTYALELLKVQEVVLPVPLLPLRGTPSAMLGIMNLRGQVVPVIDLGIHLGSSPVDMDLHTRVVVLEENGETMGLRVSAVEDVTSLTDHQIEPPDNARLCRISNNLFRGVARLGHHPMILLDATHLLH